MCVRKTVTVSLPTLISRHIWTKTCHVVNKWCHFAVSGFRVGLSPRSTPHHPSFVLPPRGHHSRPCADIHVGLLGLTSETPSIMLVSLVFFLLLTLLLALLVISQICSRTCLHWGRVPLANCASAHPVQNLNFYAYSCLVEVVPSYLRTFCTGTSLHQSPLGWQRSSGYSKHVLGHCSTWKFCFF